MNKLYLREKAYKSKSDPTKINYKWSLYAPKGHVVSGPHYFYSMGEAENWATIFASSWVSMNIVVCVCKDRLNYHESSMSHLRNKDVKIED